MKILGIETSCDETGIAILEVKNKKFRVLANELSSQVKLHAKYGGVYPTLAKREHQKNLPLILKKLLPQKIDAIAATVGPGLDPCLWTGITFAKELAKKWNLPIIPTNHIEGHLLISLLSQGAKFKIPNPKTTFPAVAMIVSGGHTQLVLVKKIGNYKIIGETLDDAAGEAFDKTARILGLPYPGGPAIAKEAEKTNFENVGGGRGSPSGARGRGETFSKISFSLPRLPRPMIHTKDFDFSFSGLKTAVLYDFQSRPKKVQQSKEYIHTMAKEIQQAIIDVLLAKTLRAAQDCDAKSIILGGGVAANEELRKQFRWKLKIGNWKLNFLAAPKNLCTDNGLMIALAGYFHKPKTRIGAEPNLRLQ